MARRGFAVFPVAAFVLALVAVPLPYYAESPGPAKDVEPRIHVAETQTFQSEGHFVLTSVTLVALTLPKLISAWRDPSETVLPESAVLLPGESQAQEQQRAISDMDQSKIDAAYVVLARLKGYPAHHGAGVLVEGVGGGCPADGRLFPGDVIDRVNGRPTPDRRTLDRVLDAIAARAPLAILVHAGGQSTTVHLVRRPCAGSRKPLIGISTVPNFPFPISISSGDIGGPSAGLMWAIGLFDLLTPGDLTGGRTIAGTGTIAPDGSVGPIGGVENKVVAAKRAGAKAFLVPIENLAAARSVGAGLPLVPVKTFADALAYLRGR